MITFDIKLHMSQKYFYKVNRYKTLPNVEKFQMCNLSCLEVINKILIGSGDPAPHFQFPYTVSLIGLTYYSRYHGNSR